MKILLTTLNSKYVHSNPALKYLYQSVLDSGVEAGPEVTLQEFTINNETDYIYGEILRGDYDLICFSTYIWNVEQTCRLCADLKKAKPSAQILLGGPEVSYETASLMRENPWIDFVLRGEGEVSFAALYKALAEQGNGRDEGFEPSEIPGLSYRGRDGAVLENPQGVLPDMRQIPFPYRSLPVEEDKVVYYETARGCPYRCSYCLSSLEKTIRPLPLERVLRELDFFLDQKVKQVKLIDRTFNYDRKRAEKIWQYLIDRDNGVTNFHFEICAELLDEEALKLLAKARQGLFQFEIGIQSTNPQTLAAVDRSSGTDRVLANIRSLIALGNSHIHVDLIAGLPFEDYETFAKSFNDVYALSADDLQLGFLKLLKGTGVRQKAEEHGYVYRSCAAYEVISNRYISAKELSQLKMIEKVLNLYKGRGGFDRTVSYLIQNVSDSPFDFYEKLSVYFYENGYQHRSHKKEDLYRILYGFVKKTESQFPGISREAEKLLETDLNAAMNFDAVKKFHKKGWDIK